MTSEDFLHSIDRRVFLKVLSLTGVAGLVYPGKLLSSLAPMALSRVVLIEDSGATVSGNVVPAVAQTMMDCGIMELAEIYDVGEAWKSLFSGIDASSVIAIKVNCINSSLPTHPEVAHAAANGLAQMDFGGTPFPENNIIIFDRTNGELVSSGYTLNISGTGVRCFGTNDASAGYSTETYDVDGNTQTLSRIVTEMADYMIDISVLKNHGTAGVTLCLKNHYGTCSNMGGTMHSNHCDPCVPALSALGPIADPEMGKQCVNICDGLLGIYTGGPSGAPQFAANTLIMSRDVVAADYWGREILEDNGCTTIGNAHHIDTAASSYNLGTNDPGNMDVVSIIDPSGIDSLGDETRPPGFVLEQNRPNPFGDRTRVRFYAPRSEQVRLTVYDTEGRRVRGLVEQTTGPGWHEAPWDGRNDSGSHVAGGVYYCQLKARALKKPS